MCWDVPQELPCGRYQKAVLGEVDSDWVEREERQSHREGYSLDQQPRGYQSGGERTESQNDQSTACSMRHAPFVEAGYMSIEKLPDKAQGYLLAHALEEVGHIS